MHEVNTPCFIHIGFAKLLQNHFPNYEFKVLQYVSELFIYNRVKKMNCLAKEKKAAEKAESNAIARRIGQGMASELTPRQGKARNVTQGTASQVKAKPNKVKTC